MARRLIERLLAKSLELDPETRQRLASVEETIIILEVVEAPESATIELMLRVNDGGVELGTSHSLQPDVRVRGSMGSMLRYLVSRFSGEHAGGVDVTIDGNLARLEEIVDIFRGLEPDWEESLAKRFGDVPARHLGTAARTLGAWAWRMRAGSWEAAVEYLQFESGTVPARAEWLEHTQRVEKLGQRLRLLEQRMAR